MSLVCDCGAIDHFTIVDPPTWWDDLVEATEWPQDNKRDFKLLVWSTKYTDEILEAATDSFIARNHRIAKNRYDDPRRGWMTYVRNEHKWQPQGAVRPSQVGRNGTRPQKETSRY